MGYAEGWAALNMEMPKRIPRTEYSAHNHFGLVRAVTGIDVDKDSPEPLKEEGRQALVKAWDYAFMWSTTVGRGQLAERGRTTDMGHAVYADGGTDRREAKKCPFDDVEEVLSFDPMEEYGVVERAEARQRFEDAVARDRKRFPDVVNEAGTYITMVSGLLEIFGWDMFLMAAGSDPARFGQVAQRYEKWIGQYFEAFAESNIPVMMVHDDITWTNGPMLHPDWYREFVFPAYKRLWRPVLDAGKRIIFTSDGNYTVFFDDIVEAGAHTLVMEPCSDMALFAEKYGKTHGFVGNADTRILLNGGRREIRAEVERCMEIGRDCPGFIMAVGNHIPPNTPVESALYYNEVYEDLAER